VSIETIVHPSEPDLLHVLLRDDAGGVGLGETHGQRSAVAAFLADLGPALSGVEASPAAVADVASRGPYGARRAGGGVSVESRAASALDIAIWDLHARREGVSLVVALGGSHRDSAATYVTCRESDQVAFANDPAGLARDVSSDGFSLVKVWPFAAGRHIEADVDWVRRLADEGIGVAVDLVGGLGLGDPATVCGLLDPLGLAWIEDPLPDDALAMIPRLARSLTTPICTGERLAGIDAFARLVDGGGLGYCHVDVAWCGGISTAIEVATLAHSHGVRLALHDFSGPVALTTSLHLAQHVAADIVVESSRQSARYDAIVSGLPPLRANSSAVGPGHGAELTDAYLAGAIRQQVM
jgi:L-alanine-DL-glutamate epimerase-like enolase superfamily enzyme